ncbi:MAG: hypothetical protein Rubg2KO_01670 [Rubricoccaceae bacterium]
MRLRLIISTLAFVAGCASPDSDASSTAEPEAPTMAALTGSWVAEAFGGEIHETWASDADGAILKTEGYYVADGDTSYSEVVNIGPIGETTYLVAHPSTGGVMVWAQTNLSDTGATFENSNNANPSRIEYAFTGDDTFTRTLIGRENDEPVVNELRFERR